MSEQTKERRNWIGVSLLVIGVALISKNYHWNILFFPDYFYSWQFILLGLGVLLLLMGRTAGIVLILIGGFFLFTEELMGVFHNIGNWWPVLLILAGIGLLTRSTSYRQRG